VNLNLSFLGCGKAYTRPAHLKRHMINSHAKVKANDDGDDSSDDDNNDVASVKSQTTTFECKSCPKKVSLQRLTCKNMFNVILTLRAATCYLETFHSNSMKTPLFQNCRLNNSWIIEDLFILCISVFYEVFPEETRKGCAQRRRQKISLHHLRTDFSQKILVCP